MKIITGITNEYKQKLTITDNTIKNNIYLTLKYYDTQLSWFYDLKYKDFNVTGRRLTIFPNILEEFRKVLPFGIRCITNDGGEPLYRDDFVSGRIFLYFLNAVEVEHIHDHELRSFIYNYSWT